MIELNNGYDEEGSTLRLEAFSDGVFAIAITLLILEIKVPSAETLNHQTLAHYLVQQWPKYFAYCLSFLIIGIYWTNHHYLFKLFRRTDHYFNLINIAFLMSIAFLPYPTDILGEFISEPEHRKFAITFYAFGIWLPAFTWCMVWFYAKNRKRIIDQRLTKSFIDSLSRQYVLSNAFYIIAFIVSLFSPLISMGICVGLTLLYLLPPKKAEYTIHA